MVNRLPKTTSSKLFLCEQDAQEFLKLLLTYMEDKLTPNMALPEKLRLLIQVCTKIPKP